MDSLSGRVLGEVPSIENPPQLPQYDLFQDIQQQQQLPLLSMNGLRQSLLFGFGPEAGCVSALDTASASQVL